MCLCSKAWASAFACILWGFYLVNYQGAIPLPCDLLSQLVMWEFGGKSLSLIPINAASAYKSQELTTYWRLPRIQFSLVSSSVWLFATPWTAVHQLPCPSSTPGASSSSCPSSCDAIQPSHPISRICPNVLLHFLPIPPYFIWLNVSLSHAYPNFLYPRLKFHC